MKAWNEIKWVLSKSVKGPKTHLSVSATGDDLVFLWVVAHRPEHSVGDHHLKTHKPPTAEKCRSDKGLKQKERREKGNFQQCRSSSVVVEQPCAV